MTEKKITNWHNGIVGIYSNSRSRILTCQKNSFTGDAMIEELEKMTLSRKSFLDIYLPAFQKVLSHFEDQNTSEKNSEAVEVEEQNADGTITIKLVVKNKKTISGRSIRVLESKLNK